MGHSNFTPPMRTRPNRPSDSTGQNGNVAVLAVVSLTLLAGLSMAQFSFTRKSIQQSNYFLSRSELRRYAESGLVTALHHLEHNLDGGQIGAVNWDSASDDLGADGISGTLDRGEGDGIPTPGEPNLAPVAVGPDALGASLVAYVSDTGVPGVKRIIAICFTDEDSVILEKQVQANVVQIPRGGPVYIDPAVPIVLNGNGFLIDGHDTNPDSTPGSGSDQFGLSTALGSTPGDNLAVLLSQIGAQQLDNIIGMGGDPSIGEATPVDVTALITHFSATPNQTMNPGTYSNVTWGDWSANDMVTTYVDGDLQLSGNGSGAGVLIVDGDLTMNGNVTFTGLVIVTGDLRLTGAMQLFGTVMVEDSGDSSVTIAGNAELIYCSAALEQLDQTATQSPGYEVVYYGERNY